MEQTEYPAIDTALSDAKAVAADPKPSIEEIRDAIAREAFERESTQRALMILAAPGAPAPEVLRHIAALDAGVRFIDACINQPFEVAKRLAPDYFKKRGRYNDA